MAHQRARYPITSTDQTDPEVFERLRRLAVKAAHGSRTALRLPPAVGVDDLTQIALIAGIEALDRWRADGGASIGTFVFHRMRGAVLDTLRGQAWPRRMRMAMRGDLIPCAPMKRRICGLYAMSALPESYLPDGFGVTGFEAPDASLMHESLREAVHRLPPRLRRVLLLYYWRGLTMREISEQIGVNESRVSQLCAKAIGLLRASLTSPQQVAA